MIQNNITNNTDTIQRNFGIDLFRIVSMLLILILHILNCGGLKGAVTIDNPNYILVGILYSISIPCVECFGGISGYVGVTSKYKYTNIVVIWLEMFLYIWLSNLILTIINEPISKELLIKSFFPIVGRYYWYMTAYFGLFILMPFINYGIQKMRFKQATLIILVLFLTFSVVPLIKDIGNPWNLNSGYSVMWLMFCYIIGAYTKKFAYIFSKIKTIYFLLVYFIFVIFLVVKYYISNNDPNSFLNSFDLFTYTSPTSAISAFCLLNIFSRIEPGKFLTKIINIFSPCVLGVFLIHCTALVWNYYFANAFVSLANINPIVFIPYVILWAIIVFLAGSIIDILRQILFNLLKIKKRIYSLEQKIFK